MEHLSVSMSLTEKPQYIRLVEFVTEVVTLARERGDDELLELAGSCLDDLLAMSGSGE